MREPVMFGKYKLSVLGAVIGGIIGYIFRPSAFLVGQLSFPHVISRGRSLKGLDQLLVPVAETSFNYLFGAIIIGAILGYALTMVLSQKK